ncbi:MAG: hypothetical protein IT353_11870 [Gemmatimonadaceae bacterium]|nr:hypothetical protein [Gemmatimonadaceae bacterium]
MTTAPLSSRGTSALLVALFCTACEHEPATRAAAAQRATATAAPWSRVAVIDPPDDSPGALGKVTGMVVDDSGRVIVYDALPSRIVRFHADGTFDRQIAREGSGPGEIRFAALGVFHDTLIVHDATLKRVTIFAPDGSLIRTFRAPCCSFESETPVDHDGHIWLRTRVGNQQEGWIRTTLRGETRDTIVDAPAGDTTAVWAMDKLRSSVGGATLTAWRVTIPLTPVRRRIPRWDGTVLDGVTSATHFAIVAATGDTLRTLSAPDQVIPVSRAQRDSVASAALALTSRIVRVPLGTLVSQVDVSTIPSRWPAWLTVRTDRRGRVWLARPPGDSAGLFFDGFDADGAPIPRARAVHPLLFEDAVFGRDHVAIRTMDASDRPTIDVYRIPRRSAR